MVGVVFLILMAWVRRKCTCTGDCSLPSCRGGCERLSRTERQDTLCQKCGSARDYLEANFKAHVRSKEIRDILYAPNALFSLSDLSDKEKYSVAFGVSSGSLASGLHFLGSLGDFRALDGFAR